ncbi:hypothetical protein GGR52DRAFT_572812 [Hypoxylon sp. FL1284]|nr:hypothetical protein GGR52DRAFT_572812 [Hypoxylon sp. FL1284]
MGLQPLTTTAPAPTLARRQSSRDHEGTPPVAALTTIWTAPEDCFPISKDPAEDIDLFWSSQPACGPPGYTSYYDTFYYSPAICPSGFTVGCSRYAASQGPDVEPTETAVLCVLSDYSCATDDWNYYATNTDLSYAQIMIQVRWAESDLSVLETHPLTPGLTLADVTLGTRTSTDAGAETVPSSPSSTLTVAAHGDEGGSGLSTGAQVGIGVGVGLFGLLGVGLALFFILRYRRNRKNASPPPIQQPPPGDYSYPVHQYPYMPAPGQPGPPGYPQTTFAGYTTYINPKTGTVTYYSAVPHPTELGGTAVEGSNLSHSSGLAGSQPIQPRMLPTVSLPAGAAASELPTDHNITSSRSELAEMPGSEGAPSAAGSDNPQSRQEMAHLLGEQAKLESRRT